MQQHISGASYWLLPSLDQEFNPELSHSINKKEKVKRNHDGVTLTQVTHGVDQGTPQTSNRGRYWCFCAIVIVLIYEETAVSFSHLLFFSAWAVMRRTSSILPNGRMTSSRLRLNQPAKQTAVKIRSKRRVKECEWERCMTTRAKNKMSSRLKQVRICQSILPFRI